MFPPSYIATCVLCVALCVSEFNNPFRDRHHKQKATPSAVGAVHSKDQSMGRKDTIPSGVDSLMDGFGAEAARPQASCAHFLYTLLPVPGKTTRPGAMGRNYDLDARCVPLRNPGRATNHHAPCCVARASSQCTRGARRLQACPLQVRASSLGRAHLSCR